MSTHEADVPDNQDINMLDQSATNVTVNILFNAIWVNMFFSTMFTLSISLCYSYR